MNDGICKKCRNEIKDTVKFCPYCGTPVVQAYEPADEKTVIINGYRSAEVNTTPQKSGKGVIIALIIAIVLVLSCTLVGVIGVVLYNNFGTVNPLVILGFVDDTEETDETDETEIQFIPETPSRTETVPETETVYRPETVPETETVYRPETEPRTESSDVYYDPVENFIVNSATTKFSYSYFSGFTANQCRLARNGIYARHGRIFDDPALTSYFSQFYWYYPRIYPDYFDEDVFNATEKYNIDIIAQYERDMGYR